MPGVPRFALHPRLYSAARIRGLKSAPTYRKNVGNGKNCCWGIGRIVQSYLGAHGAARVSKRRIDESAACLLARYCAGVPMIFGMIKNDGEDFFCELIRAGVTFYVRLVVFCGPS